MRFGTCRAAGVIMGSTIRWCAWVGTVMMCLAGCIDGAGLEVLGPSGAGETPGSQPGTGGTTVAGTGGTTVAGTGGATVPRTTGAGGSQVPTVIEPATPGPSCGLTCFAPDAKTIAHWTFDTVEKGQVADVSGNGFGATLHGSSELV